MLAMALALLMTAGACAEGMLASDLGGDIVGGNFAGEEDAGLAAPDQAIDVFSADLLVGYVAQAGALLSPFLCNEQDLVSMNRLVFESVVALDANQKPVPMLADNWTQDGTMWTFNLRKGVTFHNGAELTAFDVEASYDQFIAAGNANPYTARLNRFIEDMQAMDMYTLAVKSKYPGYMTLYAMDFPVVQSATVYDEMPRGTGPFWYVAYYMDGAVRLEANPLWWKQQSTLGSITFRYYEDVGSAIEAVQLREVDMLSTHSMTASVCRKLSNFTSMDYGLTSYEMLVPNLNAESPVADVNVRKAIMYAIDRSVLASNAYLDMAIQSEVPVLPGTWLYESQSAKYYYSPERALQLLYDSGWKDLTGDTMMNKLDGIRLRELEIEIVTYNDDTSSVRENAANLIKNYLEAVGIRAEVTVLSKSRMSDRLEDGDFDLALIGVNLSEAPVLQPLLGTGGALNFNGYSDASMDELIVETGSVTEEEALKQVFSQIQLSLVERLPIMGLMFRTGTVLSNRSLAGLQGIRSLDMFRGLEYLAE